MGYSFGQIPHLSKGQNPPMVCNICFNHTFSPLQLCPPTNPRQWGAASIVIYVPAVSLTKVSILIFYLRINPTSKYRYQVFFVLFFTIGSMIALCFALIFECHPIAKFWNPLVEGECVDVPGLYLANGILNVVADFLVLLVPIPMLVTLHVSTRHKVILAGVFATGSSCVGPLLQPPLPVDCYCSTRDAFQK